MYQEISEDSIHVNKKAIAMAISATIQKLMENYFAGTAKAGKSSRISVKEFLG